MATKKRKRTPARRAVERPSPKAKALHRKLQRLYAQKVELDLQIFAIQIQLATSRDKAYGVGCVSF
jgi:hypothetical protein